MGTRVIDRRYELGQMLGSGGMGEVFRARDTATGEAVALKLVPTEQAGEATLRAEFEVASSLRHPNVVRVREYGFTDEGQSYYTMDVIEGGVPIVDHPDALDLKILYRLSSQVCSALSYLHGRGLLHGDIKPSNMLVTGSGTDATVRMLDFGLARHRRRTDDAAGGTLGYMAPETLTSHRIDVRSELYSVGAVLYHVITQQSPLGRSHEELQRALTGQGLLSITTVEADLDPEWARLIDLLVSREPGARPASAMEVQEMLDAWAEARGTERLGPPARDADLPAPPIGGSLVGRQRELEACEEAIAAARRGSGQLLFLSGESGVGKTRLLEEVRGRAQLGRTRVVWASCAGEAPKPFRLASQIVRALEPTLPRTSAGRHAEAISVLCGAGPAGTEATPQDARLRVLAGAASLVAEASAGVELASGATRPDKAAKGKPLLVIVDDIHRADRDAADLLRALAFRVSGAHVSVLCAGRDDALPFDLGSDLEGEPFFRTVRLNRLDGTGIRELVQAALGEVTSDQVSAPSMGELADGVFRASGGNPLLAEEVLRAWADSGALVRARGNWLMRGDLIRSTPVTTAGVQEAIAARLDRLGRVTRRILVAASILGAEFEIGLLGKAVNIVPERVQEAVGSLVARGVLIPVGALSYRFAQTLVREVLYERTPADGRERIHGRILDLLQARREEGHVVGLDEIAHHALKAKRGELARTLALQAAREAEQACALERAIEWYRGVLSLGGMPPAQTAELHEKVADLALAGGKADLAQSSIDAAMPIAGARARPRLRRKRAEAQLVGGDPRRAQSECQQALSELGDAISADRLELMLVGIRATYQCGDLDQALSDCATAQQLLPDMGRPGSATAVSKLRGIILALKGNAEEGIRATRFAARQARLEGAVIEQANARNKLSMTYYFLGRYGRALAAARLAMRTYRRVGAVTLLSRAQNNLGLAALSLGRWSEAENAFSEYALASEMFGYRWGRLAAIANLAFLARHRGEFGKSNILLSRHIQLSERWGMKWLLASALQISATSLRLQSDFAGARKMLDRARELANSIDAAGLLLDVDLSQAEVALDEGDTEQARCLAERVLETATNRQAGDVRRNALLLLARVARARGRLGDARSIINEARDELARAHTPFEYAQAELERARILRDDGETGPAEHVARAAGKIFDELGARHDCAQVEKLLRELDEDPRELRRSVNNLQILLDAARMLGGVVELPRVLDTVIDHVLQVSGAERGFLILFEDSGQESLRVARNMDREAIDSSEFRGSRGLVARVAVSGKSITVTDVADDVRFRSRRSVLELGLRSMMCVPLKASNRVVGIIYIDSRRVADHFFQTDLAMLEALAQQASVAIQTARLYDDLKGKNELIGVLAHELRSPLTAIMGFSELLKLDPPDEARSRYVGTIAEQTARMSRMIKHVLDLSRLGADRVRWCFEDLAIEGPIAETLSMLEPIATSKRIGLVAQIPSDLPPVQADRDRLMQLLTNLVSNAIAYSPPETRVTVAASAAVLPGDRSGVEVRVRDQGPGIPTAERGNVFEPFARGSSSHNHDGAGLGLHICMTIVKRHTGRLWVESERGRGSTFVFQIPSVRAPTAPPPGGPEPTVVFRD